MNILTLIVTFILLVAAYVYLKPKKSKQPTEVRIRMPINMIKNEDCSIHDEELLERWLYKLYKAGVDGVVVDVIWGNVEKEKGKYDFTGYKKFVKLCKKYDLKVTCCLAFHKCDGIPLPQFVLNTGFFSKDEKGTFDDQYVSPLFDMCVMNNETTPLLCYSKLMIEFKKEFDEEIQDGIIDKVGIGLGPDGELKYPSFRGDWKMPGAGCIQCFDEIAADMLKKEEIDIPSGARNDYNEDPTKSSFWGGIEENTHAKKFFDWYNNQLCEHADRVLIEARRIIGENVTIFAKVPCINWYSSHPSHAAEATAGAYSFNDDSAFERFARSFSKFGIGLSINGLELNEDQAIFSDPKKLIQDAQDHSIDAEIPFLCENREETYDANSVLNILSWSNRQDFGVKCFTFNRLSDKTMSPNNWIMFNELVRKLHSTSF